MRPVAPLGKRSLIRRATFDLTGLPPSPEEVKAFLADDQLDAYPRLIRALLAKRQYGERWARHWLDVARYAESHGFEHDYDRPNAYHYRDFLIKALNDDIPWTTMVQWQLAGDEVAPENPMAMMATGFLGAGVYPTQITVSEAERIRYDAIDDMLATTTSAMLALTVGCARCHDHKYDPFPAVDYYRMASAFTTTVRSDVDLKLPVEPELERVFLAQLAALEQARSDYEAQELPAAMERWLAAQEKNVSDLPAARWSLLSADSLASAAGATMNEQPDRSILVTGTNARKDVYTFVGSTRLSSIAAFRIEALADASMKRNGPGRASNGNFGLSNLEVFWRGKGSKEKLKKVGLKNPRATFEQNKQNLSIAATIDADARSGWAVDPQFGKDHAAVYELEQDIKGVGEVALKVVLTFDTNTQHNFGRFRLSVSEEPAAGLPLQEDIDALRETVGRLQELLALGDTAKAVAEYKTFDPSWQKKHQAVLAHQKGDPRNKSVKAMVCAEGYKPMRHHVADGSIKDFYKETYVLHRGDVNQKQEVATPSYLQVLMRDPAGEKLWEQPKPADSKGSFRRAGMAAWMCDVDQGAGHLLARVMVNRLWQHHFGVGLVPTSNNFGFNGARPSHPELLDWLAAEFIADGWQLKPMHELIMTSATYQLGDGPQQSIDLDNQWLARRAPRRLEAEAVRDAMLAVSGRLDLTSFGPGTLSESQLRRSIYFKVKRSKLVPFLQVFDFPDTLNSLGKRSATTTSLQALLFFNHPEVRKSAEAFSQRVTAAGGDPVAVAFEQAFARLPSAVEAARGAVFIADASLADFCHALICMNEFVYIP